MPEPLLYRLPAGLIAACLLLGMILTWVGCYRAGARKAARSGARHGRGPIDAAVSGLLALILAFSFGMASQRFDEREDVIVREANALETTYLRCDFLLAVEQHHCRDALARYAALRVAFYEARHDREKLRGVVERSERLQRELWQIVKKTQRELDHPAQALAVTSLNELIDLHTERVASLRRIVPQEVTVVTLALCLGLGLFNGFSCGLAGNRWHASWVAFSALVSLVFFVNLDLDRPDRGFVRSVRGHSVMVELAQKLRSEARP